MAIKIKFDSEYNVQQPTFVLSNRSGEKIGYLPAQDIVLKDNLNSYSEVSFKVYKYNNRELYKFWDSLKNFKLAWCKEWDKWFELYVEINESNNTVKNIIAKSLSEAELSQIIIYNTEINTENDILRDDYTPTVLYDKKNPNSSLLNRVMEKAPHYNIAHVDSSISNIQRTFSFDNKSLYDVFQEIAQEIGCIFIFNNGSDENGKIVRSISVYDLESYCNDCGYRGEFSNICPDCGKENITEGYGSDTTVFISSNNIANDINFSTDTGSVKNCFKLEAGDDLMTATIRNCNPNGSDYIWHISDEIKEDMSKELSDKLSQYDIDYNYYQKDYVFNISGENLTQYNSLVDKYYEFSDNLEKIPDNIVGYPNLMNAYYGTIDLYLLLRSSLMPSVETIETTAELETLKLNSNNISLVAVQDLDSCSNSTATNAVLSMVKTLIDYRYQVKVENSSFSGNIWSGNFIITNYSDETDTATSHNLSIIISDNYEMYIRQRIENSLNKNISEDTKDISALFKMTEIEFLSEIKKYSLAKLESFRDSCQACIDILIEQGIADNETWADKEPNLYNILYMDYYNKLRYLQSEILTRENEIYLVVGKYDSNNTLIKPGLQNQLEIIRDNIQKKLNFEDYLGQDLWMEFISYRRDDLYKNENFISDGLNNSELFNLALEFLEVAKKEIFKSATQQHSISSTLKNILAIKEFRPIVDYFQVGNWIRICVDEKIYKLRLVSYEINFNDLENLPVEFSDLLIVPNGVSDTKSILEKAASMSSTYNAVSKQASKGAKGKEQLNDWVDKGLSLSTMKIVNNSDNQNLVYDSHGLLCREYLPITDTYDDEQLKIINKGVYLTDNNWLTSRAGIGKFTFFNPETNQTEESYGVIADTLVGNLILSKNVGIYNPNNSISLNDKGVVITANDSESAEEQTVFTIRKKNVDSNGNETFIPLLYVDSNGQLVLNGSINVNSSNSSISTLDDVCSDNRINSIIDNLQIGGRNYALNSDVEKTITRSTENIIVRYNITDAIKNLNDATEFVLSADLKSVNADADFKVDAYLRTESNLVTTPRAFEWIPGAEYSRFSQNVKLADGYTTSDIVYLYIRIHGGTGTLYSRNVKVEVGNKATDWTPAPEDMATKSKSVSSVDVQYALSSSSVTAPTSGWSTTAPQWESGKHMWQKTVTIYEDGTKTESGATCISGASGSDGRGVSSIVNYYLATSSSSNVTTSTSGWTPTIQTMTATKKYLWNYESVKYSDNTTETTTPAIIGVYGTEGRGIKSIVEYYMVSSLSSGITTSTSGWDTVVVNTTTTNRYLWNYEEITYTDNTSVSTTPKIIGTHGATGASAKSLSLYSSSYAIPFDENGNLKDSSSIVLTAVQQNDASAITWSAKGDGSTTITLSGSGNTKTLDPNAIKSYKSITVTITAGSLSDVATITKIQDGTSGTNGKDATVVLLTNEAHTFKGSTSAAIAGSASTDILGYVGATQKAVTIGTISGLPTGMTSAIANNGTTSAKVTFTVTTSMKTTSGTVTIPCTCNGVTVNKVFSYALSLTGATGADGKGIKSIIEQYYLSSSDTTQTGGSWKNESPKWEKGKYMWTRSFITWDDDTTTTTDPVLANALNNVSNIATTVEEELNNLQIGGRNLLPNTKTMSGYTKNQTMTMEDDAEGYTVASWPSVDELAWRGLTVLPTLPYSAVRGKTVTVSFDAKTTDPDSYNAATDQGLVVTFNLCPADSTTRHKFRANMLYTTELSDSWQRISITRTLEDNYFSSGEGTIDDDTRCYIMIYDYSVHPMDVRKIKMEFGNKATDWTPAPEDMATKSESIEIEERLNTSFQTASEAILAQVKTDYYAKGDIDTLIGSVSSSVKQTNDAVTTTFNTFKEEQVSTIGDINSLLENLTAYFKVSAEGAEIGKSDSDIISKFQNDRVGFYNSANQLLSYWTASTFGLPGLQKFVLGNMAIVVQPNGSISFVKATDEEV